VNLSETVVVAIAPIEVVVGSFPIRQAVMDRAQAPRALIVEDHDTTREVLRRLLRVCGYESDAVGSIAEADQCLHGADCIFLDLELIDGNGIELLRRIRSQNLPIRVAITTGSSHPPLLAEVTELRPDAVFMKPIDFSKLVDWLERG
jgi:CheY-like chemotaxis protein